MKKENLNLQIQSFFESGFNGKVGGLSMNPKTDVFYCDFPSIYASKEFFAEAQIAMNQLIHKNPHLLIVDDGSVECAILSALAPKIEVVPFPFEWEPEKTFLMDCQDRFQLDDPEMIAALSFTKKVKRPVIFSRWALRIQNISGYFAYVDNERFHRFSEAKKEMGLQLCWNFFKSSPSLFRSYFFHPLIKNWFEICGSEENNYEVERRIMTELATDLDVGSGRPFHKKKWILPNWTESLKQTLPTQQASFPMHLLYEQKFGVKSSLNKTERLIYGS